MQEKRINDAVEKSYLSDKMTAYILDLNGAARGGGWNKNATINPSVAHSIMAYNNDHRAGVSNCVCKELPMDTPVEAVKAMILGTIDGGTQQIKIMEEPGIKVIGQMDNTQDHTHESANRIYDTAGCSPSLTTCGGGGLEPKIMAASRGRNPENPCRYRIRKLTPRSCWRLMSFTDEEFDKASAVNSNTRLYEQAGNSIVVDVLVAIFKEIMNSEGTVNDHVGEQIDLFGILGDD